MATKAAYDEQIEFEETAEVQVDPTVTAIETALKARRRRQMGQDTEVGKPAAAILPIYLREMGATVATGRFRAEMAVELVNDGPVTVMLEV